MFIFLEKMAFSDIDVLCLKIQELREDYKVFGSKTKELLEKTIQFHHFGGSMSSEENTFWRQISTNTMKHFLWDTVIEDQRDFNHFGCLTADETTFWNRLYSNTMNFSWDTTTEGELDTGIIDDSLL